MITWPIWIRSSIAVPTVASSSMAVCTPRCCVPTRPSSTASLDHGVDVLAPTRGVALGDVLAQPPDHLAGAHGLLADPLDDVARAIRIRVRGRQHPAERAGVVADRRQRLVQLVGDRRCHLAHGGQPRDMHQLGLQFLDARLTPPLGGDVAHDLRGADDRARPDSGSARSSATPRSRCRPCAAGPSRNGRSRSPRRSRSRIIASSCTRSGGSSSVIGRPIISSARYSRTSPRRRRSRP